MMNSEKRYHLYESNLDFVKITTILLLMIVILNLGYYGFLLYLKDYCA